MVFEGLDNYSFDKTAVDSTSIFAGHYVIKDVKYGNSYNELTECTYSFYHIQRMAKQGSYELPYYDEEFDNGINQWQELTEPVTLNNVYKDAREKLIFTIYLPNAAYVNDLNASICTLKVSSRNLRSHTITRTYSRFGNIGELINNDKIFTGDILEVSATPLSGYSIEGYQTRYTVGHSDISINLYAIKETT